MTNFHCNVSVIITTKNIILLAKRSLSDSKFPGLWCIPGGNFDYKDNSLEDIAIRECKEEVGLNIKKENLRLFQNNIVIIDNQPKLYVVFIAKIKSIKELKKNFNNEITEIKWVSKTEIENMNNIIPYTKKLLLSI